MAKNTTLIVRQGRTVQIGEAQKDDDGKPTKPTITEYGPGQEITVDAEEADRLIALGSVALKGTPEADLALAESDALPEDFPSRAELAAAGIDTFTALATVEDFTDIDGVGPRKAEAIADAVEERRVAQEG